MTKQIKLPKNQVALVDDWNYEWLSQYVWYIRWDKCTNGFYAQRTEGTKRATRFVVYMAREIMNTPKGMFCDHINHNTLDNREENLRNVTRSQNMMNRKGANSINKLGEKDIRRYDSGFMVRVRVEGRVVFCKTFKSLDEAIMARNEAITKYHGEFGHF